MLSDMESAIAFIEKQDIEIISRIKDEWNLALKEASKVLPRPEKLLVEYNPAIFRVSRHPVGIRLVSSPWGNYFIFEFATPNNMLPFDIFESTQAKTGVMVHELSHLIDDKRWGFDLTKLIEDSSEYVTREQRAELMGFASCPVGIFEANRALIESTIKKLGYESEALGSYIKPLAAVETLGRIGMQRSDDLVRFYAEIEAVFPIHRVLEEYLSTNVFSLAGFVTSPELNKSSVYGIKKVRDLSLARDFFCEYLKGKISINELEEKLEKLNYKMKVDSGIQAYNPLNCINFLHFNSEIAKKNIASALNIFMIDAPWRCFEDLQNALKEIEAQIP